VGASFCPDRDKGGDESREMAGKQVALNPKASEADEKIK
jgi:hypothetical protein